RIDLVADAIGRNGQPIFEKGDAPADQHHHPQRRAVEFEVPVPGKGHEDIGGDEQPDRGQGRKIEAKGFLLRVQRSSISPSPAPPKRETATPHPPPHPRIATRQPTAASLHPQVVTLLPTARHLPPDRAPPSSTARHPRA